MLIDSTALGSGEVVLARVGLLLKMIEYSEFYNVDNCDILYVCCLILLVYSLKIIL